MDRRLRFSVLLGVALAPAPVRADVTVLYAPPAPPAPLVAEVVCGPVVEAEPEADAPRAEPATRPAIEPAPVEREPAPRVEPTAVALAPRIEPEPAVEEREAVEREVVERAPRAAEPAALAPRERDELPAPATPAGPIRFVRVGDGSREEISLRLLDDAGRPSPEALTALSILARPGDADAPSARDVAAHEGDLEWVATGIRRLHPGLLLRLSAIVERFGARPFEIVSGYRPDARETSRHRIGRALDLRVVGVPVEELDAFVATLPETGVGLYPTTDFVHVDVRERRTHWVDVSGPGEPPRAPSEASEPSTRGSADEGPAPERPAPESPVPESPTAEDPVDEDAILDAVTRGLRGVDVR